MRIIHVFAMALFAIAATAASAAIAQDYQSGPLKIEHPWARPSYTANGSVYMTLSNGGDVADRLLAVKTNVAGDVMLHESRMEGEVMKMVPLDERSRGSGAWLGRAEAARHARDADGTAAAAQGGRHISADPRLREAGRGTHQGQRHAATRFRKVPIIVGRRYHEFLDAGCPKIARRQAQEFCRGAIKVLSASPSCRPRAWPA